jgi:hypothetical protein
LSLSGNVISTLNVTGNINSANVSVTANIYAENIIYANGQLGGTNIQSQGFVSAVGNVISGNVYTGNLSLSGNVLSAINSTSNITTTANVAANYFLGNGSQLTGLSASKIFNGTSEANIGTANGNANISINGVSNVAVFTSSGLDVTGNISANGNITANGTISTGGAGTGNITGANIISAVTLSASGDVIGVVFLMSILTFICGFWFIFILLFIYFNSINLAIKAIQLISLSSLKFDWYVYSLV